VGLQNQFAEAADQYRSALKIYEQIEGPRGRNARNAAMGLAIVQQGEGGSAQASSLMQRAMDSSSNPADLDGATLNNLANLARDKKQYTEAESLYKKACVAYEKSGGPNDAGLATAFANLGKLYRDESQFDISKAELPLKRALAIRENVLAGCGKTAQRISSKILVPLPLRVLQVKCSITRSPVCAVR
jgi:tetratricopeptide (TPR) repeat protein